MLKRNVRRRPARPIKDSSTGLRGHTKRFLLSFTPSYFKEYWFSRAGLGRIAKLGGLGVLFVFLVFLWYAKDLPSPNKVNARISAQTTKFYARDELTNPGHGTLLYELYGDKNRSVIEFDQMPKCIKDATIAIEDKDFYKHGAFSIFGIGRAIQGVVFRDRSKGGGSTITQQYVKNALLTNEYSYSRKIKELILAIEIEQFYSKDDILKLYLNEIPYGSRAYGIQSAAQTYFKTDAKNLTLPQCALLAAVPNAPGTYSPYGTHIDKLIQRQQLILDLMAEQGYITPAQAAEAKTVSVLAPGDAPGQFQRSQNLYANIKAPHFVLYAQELLQTTYGAKQVSEGGLKVITTLDWGKQQAAEKAVGDNMARIRSNKGSNAALVSTDPKTGQILAMVGSADFGDDSIDGQVNVATSERQPGSSFKPIVYATLMGKNKDAACTKNRSCATYGPGTVLYDVPSKLDASRKTDWPQNYGNRVTTYSSVRAALGGSLNIPAVKSLYMAGISDSLDTAKRLGITTLNRGATNYGLALVLGAGEVQLNQMANAYESFANGGQHYQQTPILKVFDDKGGVLDDNTKPKKPKRALDEQVAYLMADVLSDNNAKRTVFSRVLDIKNGCSTNQSKNCIHAGVKTGTTEFFNDAWTVGFTPNMTAAVWVGNNDNKPMSAAAAAIAAPVWVQYMNTVHAAGNVTSTDAFEKPNGIKSITLDRKTGRTVTQATASSDKVTDQFPSWYVPMTSVGGKSAEIDKVSGKLATACTPELARTTAYSSAIVPEIPSSDPAYGNWLGGMQRRGIATGGTALPTESDDAHECGDTKPIVSISGAVGGGPYSLNVNVTLGTFGTTKTGTGTAQLQVYFDDQIIYTNSNVTSGSYSVDPYSPATTGSHTFKAVITDTGLYQDTDEATVNVTNVSSFEGTSPGNSVAAGLVDFTWTSSGNAPYTLFISGRAPISNINATHRNNVAMLQGNYTWYVQDNNGNVTPTRNLNVHL